MSVQVDDSNFITGHNNGSLVFWSRCKREKVFELPNNHSGEPINSVCVSKDITLVLSNGVYC